MRAARPVGALAAAAIMLGSCSGDAEPSTSSTTVSTASTAGAGTTKDAVDDAATFDPPPDSTGDVGEPDVDPVGAVWLPDARPSGDPVAGEVTIDACRWNTVGEYELAVTWEPDEPGAAAEIGVELTIPSQEGLDQRATGVASLAHGGSFEVPIDVAVQVWSDDDVIARAFRQDPNAEVPRDVTCSIDVVSGRIFRNHQVDLEIAPAPARHALFDSLQEIATTDLALLPIASVMKQLEQSNDLPFDRLWVAPRTRLASIEVIRDGSCLRVEQRYDVTAPDGESLDPVGVEQSHGCIDLFPPGAGARMLRIGDPNWRVVVEGRAGSADRVAERLVGYTVGGAEPVTGAAEPTADEYFAGYVAERPSLRIVARFPWRDGEVAIVEDSSARADARFLEPVVYTLAGFNPGGGGIGCREYTVGHHDDEVDGYRFFVATTAGLVFSTPLADGSTHVAELDEVEPGLWVGFLDHAAVRREIVDAGGSQFRMIAQTEVTNPDGSPATCTQR